MNFTQAQNYEILEDIIKNGAGIEEILRMSLEILMKFSPFTPPRSVSGENFQVDVKSKK